MNTKHTPGPWYEYDMGWSGQTAIAVKHANSNFLIVPAMNKGANARLIAQSPTMYDFLWMIANGGINEAGEAQIESEARAILSKINNTSADL